MVKNVEDKTIASYLEEKRQFPPPKEFSEKAHIKSMEQYEALYKKSIEDPNTFWAEQAEAIDWYKKWDKVEEYDFNELWIRYFAGGKLNVSYNCLDRHLKTWRRNKAAIVWEGEPGDTRTLTYQELHHEVCKFAGVLKRHGIKKGDCVTIYLPMIPELPIAMLACARIGAVHSVVFAGFSASALEDRIKDAKAKMLITADGSFRHGKIIPLKQNADEALNNCPEVKTCIVVKRTGLEVPINSKRDFWWEREMADSDIKLAPKPEIMDAEDILYILYTSGSTGKPKGVIHTTGGYLVYVNLTFRWIFDYRDEDVYWCTADIGWVTGHSYIVYGPLSAGATSLMFESVPTYPEPDRYWEIVEKYRVNIFYTAPTVIRALMREGENWPRRRDLSSLRLLGTVGEPINPEAWMWYYRYIGRERCPVVDTWWQTENGGILITPLPGAMTLKPGSANRPFPGVVAEVLREDGTPAAVNEGGYVVVSKAWPGILRGLFNDPGKERFREVYFSRFPGKYLSGDGAKIDEAGDFWFMGRIDDVMNVSGHRIGTAEVESALVSHKAVAEAAVVGFPHQIKGQGIYAFVTLKEGLKKTEELKKTLSQHVRKEIGPIAQPDYLQFADDLPKTRSGKIMRRILKKIAAGDVSDLGDISTLADPTVVDQLIKATT
ncbi:MAG: acetate--CoA ligase [Actinomycetota bacterium]